MSISLPKRPTTLLALLPVLAAASLAATACGGVDMGGTSEEDSSTTAGATTTDETTLASEPDGVPSPSPVDPGALGVFFPRHSLSQDDPMPLTNTVGELIVDDAGCLRLVGGDSNGTVLIWPREYGLGTKNGDIYVLDRKGEVVVGVGDVVDAGGLGLGTSYRGSLVVDREGGQIEGEQARRELYERCPGSYWLAGRRITPSDELKGVREARLDR